MKLFKENLSAIKKNITNPRDGLSKDIFEFVSELTPLVCVDLLIKNKSNAVLLTWRDDEFYGPGWHFPGGIIRFKEEFKTRISKVAKMELGVKVKNHKYPLMIHEAMNKTRDTRGHFICLLFKVHLLSDLDPKKEFNKSIKDQNGFWKWHEKYPSNIIKQHKIYKKYFNSK